eukprot:COSAG01_NODE_25926_length_729_cov_0.563492_1_plen_103_part_10
MGRRYERESATDTALHARVSPSSLTQAFGSSGGLRRWAGTALVARREKAAALRDRRRHRHGSVGYHPRAGHIAVHVRALAAMLADRGCGCCLLSLLRGAAVSS